MTQLSHNFSQFPNKALYTNHSYKTAVNCLKANMLVTEENISSVCVNVLTNSERNRWEFARS